MHHSPFFQKGESSDDTIPPSNSSLHLDHQGLRKPSGVSFWLHFFGTCYLFYMLRSDDCSNFYSLQRKINEVSKTASSSDFSCSSLSSSQGEEEGRRRRRRKHSKHKRSKKDHDKKDRKSSKSKHHKNNVISSDSEDENQPSASKGRPSRRRRSHNSSSSKSTLQSTKDLSSLKSLPHTSKFKSCPVSSDCDNSPPRSTIRSAIVQSNHSRRTSIAKDDVSPPHTSGPKLRNIVMTRTTTGEGHDSWRVTDTTVSPAKHRTRSVFRDGHRSSSHHASESPSHPKHRSSPQHSKHQLNHNSDTSHNKKRKSFESGKDSRCLLDVKIKKKCRDRSRSSDSPFVCPKKSQRPLAYSDDSD